MNARVDYRFNLTESLNLTAFLWIQNLLDTDNTLEVYQATGLASEDGWRSSGEGQDFLSNQEIPANASYLYGARVLDPRSGKGHAETQCQIRWASVSHLESCPKRLPLQHYSYGRRHRGESVSPAICRTQFESLTDKGLERSSEQVGGRAGVPCH